MIMPYGETNRPTTTTSMPTADRYKWMKPGDKGQRRTVALSALKIDPSYQRGEVSDANTLAIARDFSWVAFNTIVVMERSNGDLYVVDGQQRCLAARRRGDITTVPAVVFVSDGPIHEAQAFKSLNERRQHVTAYYKFRAAVVAGNEPEVSIASYLESLGMAVGSDGNDPQILAFPTGLIRTWKKNPDLTKRAILAQLEIRRTKPLQWHVHKGICWLLHKGVQIENYVDIIERNGGAAALSKEIRTMKVELNQEVSERVAGLAILRFINKQLKTRKIKIAD